MLNPQRPHHSEYAACLSSWRNYRTSFSLVANQSDRLDYNQIQIFWQIPKIVSSKFKTAMLLHVII